MTQDKTTERRQQERRKGLEQRSHIDGPQYSCGDFEHDVWFTNRRIPGSDRRVAQRRKVDDPTYMSKSEWRVHSDRRHSSGAARPVAANANSTGMAKRAAGRIFDLFKNASYFSTRNAEHKSQMLDGWAAIIDEEFAAAPAPSATGPDEAEDEAKFAKELAWDAVTSCGVHRDCEQSIVDRIAPKIAYRLAEAYQEGKRAALASSAPTPGRMPSCHNCGAIMEGVCPNCKATTGCAPTPLEVTPATEEEAREWLGRKGLADLSLYWPTNKPIPQIDYESGEPQTTLPKLLVAFAHRTSSAAEGTKEK